METTDSINAGSVDSAAADARRAKERFPMNTVLKITPLDRNRQLMRGQSFTAIGKDVSTTGIAVSHTEPMLHSRAVITTDDAPGSWPILRRGRSRLDES